MSVAKLNILWSTDERTNAATLMPFDRPRGLDFELERACPRVSARCPGCDSVVYSRRHRLCGRCGRELPSECLFSSFEAARVEALLHRERQQHRRWLQRVAQTPLGAIA